MHSPAQWQYRRHGAGTTKITTDRATIDEVAQEGPVARRRHLPVDSNRLLLGWGSHRLALCSADNAQASPERNTRTMHRWIPI
jgi:hypothetical protein